MPEGEPTFKAKESLAEIKAKKEKAGELEEYVEAEKEFEPEEEVEKRKEKTREEYEKMNFKQMDEEFDELWREATNCKKARELRRKIMDENLAKEGFDYDTFYEIWGKKDKEERMKREEEEKNKAREEIEKAI